MLLIGGLLLTLVVFVATVWKRVVNCTSRSE
jgi:hypothetical protein